MYNYLFFKKLVNILNYNYLSLKKLINNKLFYFFKKKYDFINNKLRYNILSNYSNK